MRSIYVSDEIITEARDAKASAYTPVKLMTPDGYDPKHSNPLGYLVLSLIGLMDTKEQKNGKFGRQVAQRPLPGRRVDWSRRDGGSLQGLGLQTGDLFSAEAAQGRHGSGPGLPAAFQARSPDGWPDCSIPILCASTAFEQEDILAYMLMDYVQGKACAPRSIEVGSNQ